MVRYKNQKQTKLKKIILLCFVFLMVLLLIAFIALNLLSVKEVGRQQAIMEGQFSSVQDILEYYGCKYIKMKESEEDGFLYDIYTSFKYELYEEEKSNESFYNDVIGEIAKFLKYSSFRLIDETKEEEIEIQVICEENQIETIIINGIEDYFIYMDSQIDLRRYQQIKTTDIFIQAPELQSCVENNWSTEVDFGSRETVFQNYYLFFDEGIKTRKINGKLYNIIFTDKYTNPVVNDLTVGRTHEEIIEKMGEPTFQNANKTILGYKGKEVYVFFEENQISIYRHMQEEGYDEFLALVDEFLGKRYSFLEFMNELTYLWPDYEEYTYTENSVFLSYPNKGVEIKLNYENTDGIILYNNIGVAQEVVKEYLKHTELIANLQIDSVFEAEKRRFEKEENLLENCKDYQEKYEQEDTRNRGQTYQYYMKMSDTDKIMSAYFIAQNADLPNCELNEAIDTYIWLNEDCFVYSVMGKGIYYYDLKNQRKGTLTAGDRKSQYKIKTYENGILTYDETSLEIQF